MKILYITNHIDIARASGGFINDYQNDLVFYGLRELFGDDVVDSTQIISLYKAGLIEPFAIKYRNIYFDVDTT